MQGMFRDYTPVVEFRQLEAGLVKYQLVDDAEIMAEKNRKEMDYMVGKVNDKCGMEEVRDLEKDLSFRIQNNFDKSAKLEHTTKALEEINLKHDELQRMLNLTIEKQGQIAETVALHTRQIATKIEQREIDDLRELVKILPNRDDIEALKTQLYKELKEFRTDNDNFHQDF